MPRKITTDAIAALLSAKPFRRDNTTVEVGHTTATLYLFDRPIIRRYHETGEIQVNAGGYRGHNGDTVTTTTKERLNGLPGVRVWCHRGVTYLTSANKLKAREWDGTWAKV